MRIAVVGGGPGGGAAALALARGGADVTLHLPSVAGEKPCGGALPGSLVAELPGFDPSALPVCRIGRATIENAAGGQLTVALEGLEIYRRRELDAALVEAAAAAGARLEHGKVRRLEPSPDGVRLGGAAGVERYDWLIAADGARGLSRRRLGLAPAGESLGLGASLELDGDAELVLSFPDVADAYLWIFPRPGGVSVGIAYGAEQLSSGAAGALLDGFLARHLPAAAAAGGRYRYPIPVFTPRSLADLELAAARRTLLVGDAAALADPLTREGIRPAVRSGLWAAASLLAGRPQDYPRTVASRLAGEMERARRAAALFYEDRLGQWMVPVSRGLPGVARVLADLLACRQPYGGLRRRLLRAAVSFRTGSRSAPSPGSRGWSS